MYINVTEVCHTIWKFSNLQNFSPTIVDLAISNKIGPVAKSLLQFISNKQLERFVQVTFATCLYECIRDRRCHAAICSVHFVKVLTNVRNLGYVLHANEVELLQQLIFVYYTVCAELMPQSRVHTCTVHVCTWCTCTCTMLHVHLVDNIAIVALM